ncbi:hypothetical protein SAMN04488057_10378 [Cyclobacterium lianum]|uniref:Uncharacterized protein n=1 Tax=Cyclobacterium lianum TaxID=388280 RepID=A0A1M7L343_9BACT|nr:hypothetical protein SAMN04488057_10378 [Cyclobacterium lianum]
MINGIATQYNAGKVLKIRIGSNRKKFFGCILLCVVNFLADIRLLIF